MWNGKNFLNLREIFESLPFLLILQPHVKLLLASLFFITSIGTRSVSLRVLQQSGQKISSSLLLEAGSLECKDALRGCIRCYCLSTHFMNLKTSWTLFPFCEGKLTILESGSFFLRINREQQRSFNGNFASMVRRKQQAMHQGFPSQVS